MYSGRTGKADPEEQERSLRLSMSTRTCVFLCQINQSTIQWDVEVCLSEAQEACLRDYARTHDELLPDPEVMEIYTVVFFSLIEICADHINPDTLFDLRERYGEGWDDSIRTCVRNLLQDKGFVILIPDEFRQA